MEPRQSLQEQAPTPGVDQIPSVEFSLPTPEMPEESAHERLEARPSSVEVNHQVSQAMPSVLPSPIVSHTQGDATGPVDDTPIVAADEDLIEKEWVDKAKQIIVNTKDDPYRREQEIKRLQLDYVRKRYGKEIGAARG